ncbi:MAG TPA: laccase domain-containing protein, partial [Dehalococcoidia bacterium]|nr:laccase domain-containing protein [Dehalococcoidia bacterium]
GEDVARAVREATPAGACDPVLLRPGKRPHLDLALALRGQLQAAGVPPEQIEEAPFCTACRTDLFYSHRAEGEPTGRFGAFIGLRP